LFRGGTNEPWPLRRAVDRLNEKRTARFCMPGHKGKLGAGTADDWTELPETGNLYGDAGPTAASEKMAAKAFGAERCFYLTGGSTQGIAAALGLCRGAGEALLCDRNCHRSATSAMILYDYRPYYIKRDILPGFGISAPVDPMRVKEGLERSGAKTVLITSPTYYGVVSDIETIYGICRDFGARLVVDCAHGAHFGRGGLPPAPWKLGADITVASGHKTLDALGQGAYLFTTLDFDPSSVRKFTALTGTSSPSYPIMLSLEASARRLSFYGDELWSACVERCRRLSEAIKADTPFAVLDEGEYQGYYIKCDRTRLVVSAFGTDTDGYELYDRLYSAGVILEMCDKYNVVAILTPNDGDDDLRRLCDGLIKIGRSVKKKPDPVQQRPTDIPKAAMTPREAAFLPAASIEADSAVGRIAAGAWGIYPPGIPVIQPGEVLDEGIIALMKKNGVKAVEIVDIEDVKQKNITGGKQL